MFLLSPSEPIGFLLLDLQVRLNRVRNGELDAGATAIEWVIITVVLVGLAIAVGVAVTKVVKDQTAKIKVS